MPVSQRVGAKYDAIGGCVRVCGVSRWLIKKEKAPQRVKVNQFGVVARLM